MKSAKYLNRYSSLHLDLPLKKANPSDVNAIGGVIWICLEANSYGDDYTIRQIVR